MSHVFGTEGWGGNNQIKTLKRQARGFRDTEFFKLRIMGNHEAKYSSLAG